MAELETRRLGRTEMRPKAVGIGWASLSRHTDEESIEAVRTAIELGINYLDTSPAYGDSERKLGLALEGGWRDKIYLETKAGSNPQRRGYSAEDIRWSVNNSFKTLKTDYLDAVLIHDPGDIDFPLADGNGFDELLKMKDEGVIGFVGLGVRSHEFHKKAIESGKADIILTYLDYTLIDQSAGETTIPLAKKHDVGLILASILSMNHLTGQEPKNNPRAHDMWEWCNKRGLSIRDLAIQFCLAVKMDGIVMPGPGTKKHVEEVYESAIKDIPPEIWHDFKAEFGVGL
jgi:aryl-alcohol dehydrogenase-like predicted oxidoreductase